MSLVYGDDFYGKKTLAGLDDGIFRYFFRWGMRENNLRSAKYLILPAVELTANCYYGMFTGSSGLTEAPELPATKLASACYRGMFSGCKALTSAPELPATELTEHCYYYMFGGCTSLERAPILPATSAASACCIYMFSGCTKLSVINCSLIDDSYYFTAHTKGWVYGVSEKGLFLKNPTNNSWPTNSVNGIPSGWIIRSTTDLAVNTETITLTEAKKSEKIVVYSPNGGWTATTSDDWITLSRNAGNSGFTDIFVTIETSGVARTGSVTFTDGRQTVSISIEEGYYKDKEVAFNITSGGVIYWKSTGSAFTPVIQYKKNNGSWTNITSTTAGTKINVSKGDTVKFRGNNEAYWSGNTYCTFSGTTAKFTLEGNIMSLINSDVAVYEIETVYSGKNGFLGLFRNCTGLSSCERFVLPALTLFSSGQSGASGCYASLFSGCTSLEVAPVLPATTLAQSCYQYMFYGCTSLKNAPELPATTITEHCYSHMFQDCTSLINAPIELPAGTAMTGCYSHMFAGCSSLVNAPVISATSIANSSCGSMFSGCTSLVNAPELNAMTIDAYGYSGMFAYCTSLVNAPELPATDVNGGAYMMMFRGCKNLLNGPTVLPAMTLRSSATYQYMFEGCSSLVSAPQILATSLGGSNACGYMFSGCTSLTSAPNLLSTALTYRCYSHMFAGCSSLVNAPVISATTVSGYSCESMFYNCRSLVNAPALPATTLTNYCYYYMFAGCSSLVNAPALPATTLASYCYYYMFYGCTSLEVAPVLPATTLVTGSYQNMFRSCSKLKYIKCLALNISSNTSLWTDGVASSGTFVKSEAMEDWPRGTNGIPNGWEVQNA